MISPMSVILLLAIAVGGALGVVLLSGRMSEAWRARIRVAMIVLLYPALIVSWAVRAFEQASEGDWLPFAIQGGAAIAFSVIGVIALRERRLWPKALHP